MILAFNSYGNRYYGFLSSPLVGVGFSVFLATFPAFVKVYVLYLGLTLSLFNIVIITGCLLRPKDLLNTIPSTMGCVYMKHFTISWSSPAPFGEC